MNWKSLLGVLSLVTGSWFSSSAQAAELTTALQVRGMHCISCARKVSGHLQAVPEVGTVNVDVETGEVNVVPKAQIAPSPRLLWEAIERAGYQPVRLSGPYGVFTAKPST